MSGRAQSARTVQAETLPSENAPHADALTQQLLSLREENTRIGKQNQELSAKLHDVTTYNQNLGLELYRLDQEISDLEDKLNMNKDKTRHVREQTKQIRKRTEKCKMALSKDQQMAELARRFEAMQAYKDRADKNIEEIHKLLDDPNFQTLKENLDIVAEKIHFLYWNNNELSQQIESIQQFIEPEDKENESINFAKDQWREIKIEERGTKSDTDIKHSHSSLHNEVDEQINHSEASGRSGRKSGASFRAKLTQKKSSSRIENEEEGFRIVSPGKSGNQSESSKRSRKGQYSRVSSSLKKAEDEEQLSEVSEAFQEPNEYSSKSHKSLKSVASPTHVIAEPNIPEEKLQSDKSKRSRSRHSQSSRQNSSLDKLIQDKVDVLAESNHEQLDQVTTEKVNNLLGDDNTQENNETNNLEKLVVDKIENLNGSPQIASPKEAKNAPTRRSRATRHHKTPPRIPFESDYDFFESDIPPNPKKGTVRPSENDPEFEYEYYDSEEADDEYEIADEVETPDVLFIEKFKDENAPKGKYVILKTLTKKPPPEPVYLNIKPKEEIKQIEPIIINIARDRDLQKGEIVNLKENEENKLLLNGNNMPIPEERIKMKTYKPEPVVIKPKVGETKTIRIEHYKEEYIKMIEAKLNAKARKDEKNAKSAKLHAKEKYKYNEYLQTRKAEAELIAEVEFEAEREETKERKIEERYKILEENMTVRLIKVEKAEIRRQERLEEEKRKLLESNITIRAEKEEIIQTEKMERKKRIEEEKTKYQEEHFVKKSKKEERKIRKLLKIRELEIEERRRREKEERKLKRRQERLEAKKAAEELRERAIKLAEEERQKQMTARLEAEAKLRAEQEELERQRQEEIDRKRKEEEECKRQLLEQEELERKKKEEELAHKNSETNEEESNHVDILIISSGTYHAEESTISGASGNESPKKSESPILTSNTNNDAESLSTEQKIFSCKDDPSKMVNLAPISLQEVSGSSNNRAGMDLSTNTQIDESSQKSKFQSGNSLSAYRNASSLAEDIHLSEMDSQTPVTSFQKQSSILQIQEMPVIEKGDYHEEIGESSSAYRRRRISNVEKAEVEVQTNEMSSRHRRMKDATSEAKANESSASEPQLHPIDILIISSATHTTEDESLNEPSYQIQTDDTAINGNSILRPEKKDIEIQPRESDEEEQVPEQVETTSSPQYPIVVSVEVNPDQNNAQVPITTMKSPKNSPQVSPEKIQQEEQTKLNLPKENIGILLNLSASRSSENSPKGKLSELSEATLDGSDVTPKKEILRSNNNHGRRVLSELHESENADIEDNLTEAANLHEEEEDFPEIDQRKIKELGEVIFEEEQNEIAKMPEEIAKVNKIIHDLKAPPPVPGAHDNSSSSGQTTTRKRRKLVLREDEENDEELAQQMMAKPDFDLDIKKIESSNSSNNANDFNSDNDNINHEDEIATQEKLLHHIINNHNNDNNEYYDDEQADNEDENNSFIEINNIVQCSGQTREEDNGNGSGNGNTNEKSNNNEHGQDQQQNDNQSNEQQTAPTLNGGGGGGNGHDDTDPFEEEEDQPSSRLSYQAPHYQFEEEEEDKNEKEKKDGNNRPRSSLSASSRSMASDDDVESEQPMIKTVAPYSFSSSSYYTSSSAAEAAIEVELKKVIRPKPRPAPEFTPETHKIKVEPLPEPQVVAFSKRGQGQSVREIRIKASQAEEIAAAEEEMKKPKQIKIVKILDEGEKEAIKEQQKEVKAKAETFEQSEKEEKNENESGQGETKSEHEEEKVEHDAVKEQTEKEERANIESEKESKVEGKEEAKEKTEKMKSEQTEEQDIKSSERQKDDKVAEDDSSEHQNEKAEEEKIEMKEEEKNEKAPTQKDEVFLDLKDFQVVGKPKKSEEPEKKPHALTDRPKPLRRSIDADGNEFEYDYEYEYEYDDENEQPAGSASPQKKNNTTTLLPPIEDTAEALLPPSAAENAAQPASKTQPIPSVGGNKQQDSTIEEEDENSAKQSCKDIFNIISKDLTGSKDDEKKKTKKRVVKKMKKRVPKNKYTETEEEDDIQFGPNKGKPTKSQPVRRPLQSARRKRPQDSPRRFPSKNEDDEDGRQSSRRPNRGPLHSFGEDPDNPLELTLRKDELLIDIDSSELDEGQQPGDENALIEAEEEEEFEYEYEEVIEYEYEYDETDDEIANIKIDANSPHDSNQNLNQKNILEYSENDNDDEYDNENVDNEGKPKKRKRKNTSQSKPTVDYTENERAFEETGHNERLEDLVNKVRQETVGLSNEALAEYLEKLRGEIAEENAHGEEMKAQLEELKTKRDTKVEHVFQMVHPEEFGYEPVAKTSILSSKTVQTDVTGARLESQQQLIKHQDDDREAIRQLQNQIDSTRQRIAEMDQAIKEAEVDNIAKIKRAQRLREELTKVKAEVANAGYDVENDKLEARTIQRELDNLTKTVNTNQARLDKANTTVSELTKKLQEMTEYRAVLESELDDLYNREKPEVRQLILDVKNSRQVTEETTQKVQATIERIAAKRDRIDELMQSDEKRQVVELKMQEAKLARRLRKWQKLAVSDETMQQIEHFSQRNAYRRNQIKEEIELKERQLFEKNERVAALQNYSNMIEAMLVEHKQNWS